MVSLVDSLLVLAITIELFNAPFTKVEESFNIQAIHDILSHGTNLSKYDHNVFPGAVPRTFIGSLLLSILLKPVHWLIAADETDFDLQIIARGVLGLINALGLISLKDSLIFELQKKNLVKGKKRYNYDSIGYWFVFFQITQFHMMFYASRTLPNFMVLPLTNYALSKVILGNFSTAIAILAFSTVVFRIELLALMLSIGFVGFVLRKVSIVTLVKSSIIGAIIGAFSSGVVDSFFWQRFTIPEVESFVFNVIEGKSELWGTEPIHAYFSKYLLSIFLPPTVLALQGFGIFNDPTTKKSLQVLGPAIILYVAILSLQPHKEWRFIVYVIPVFNLIASTGAFIITKRSARSFVYKLATLAIIGTAFIALVITSMRFNASAMNYPGGLALHEVNEIILKSQTFDNPQENVIVHMDVPACMTGVTLFGELNQRPGLNVTYDKTEDPVELSTKWETFDYLITEVEDAKYLPKITNYEWLKLSSVKGFAGMNTGLIKSAINKDFILSVLNVTIKSQSLETIKNIFNSLFVLKDYLHIYIKVKMNSQESEKFFNN